MGNIIRLNGMTNFTFRHLKKGIRVFLRLFLLTPADMAGCLNDVHRGSYMSAHILLNLLNELGERDKMRGLPSILSLFRNEFNIFNNTRARMLDSMYHMTFRCL